MRWLVLVLMLLPFPATAASLNCSFPKAMKTGFLIPEQTFLVSTMSLGSTEGGSDVMWRYGALVFPPRGELLLTVFRGNSQATLDLYVGDAWKLRSQGRCVYLPWEQKWQRLYKPGTTFPWYG